SAHRAARIFVDRVKKTFRRVDCQKRGVFGSYGGGASQLARLLVHPVSVNTFALARGVGADIKREIRCGRVNDSANACCATDHTDAAQFEKLAAGEVVVCHAMQCTTKATF